MRLQPVILYFTIAFLTQLLMAEKPPADWFSWLKWIGMSLLQGCIAIKAFLSTPPPKASPPIDIGVMQALKGGGRP